jgi:phage terminase large subunit
MARKRLSALAIEKLEAQIDDAMTDVAESAIFGICDMQKNVIKRLRMTATGVDDVTNATTHADHLIPAKLERLLYPKPWKVVYGGRGSAKTRTVSTILTESARFKSERIGCFREIQQSIEDSSYQELVDEIDRKGESKEYRCIDGKITHKKTKSKFRFRGLYRNVTGVKGFAGITKAWIEEAENVSQASWDILEPTVRNPGAEIWVTFNPNKETDATWTQWVAPWHDKMVNGIYEDDEILIIECNWTDNPWMTEELIRSKDKMKRVDFDRYMWIWEGKFNKRSDEQVFGGKWRIDNFEVKPEWHGPYFGMDFGFSTDPTAMVEVYIEESPGGRRNIYINREYGKVGLEITDTPAAMEQSFTMAKRARWYADCARPETISHIKRSGFDIHPCTKWPGSVEDGVTWLRGCDSIVIHERCKEMQNEAVMYSYKVDKLTGNVLTDIVDAYNHYWDAVRYALNDHIVQRGSGMLIRRRR